MIVSDLEGLLWRLILGGIMDAAGRGALSIEVNAYVDGILDWLRTPGITPAAQTEVNEGRIVVEL